jgi:hypothetical protein
VGVKKTQKKPEPNIELPPKPIVANNNAQIRLKMYLMYEYILNIIVKRTILKKTLKIINCR